MIFYASNKAKHYPVRSGYTDLSGGGLEQSGNYGHWWSISANNYTSDIDAKANTFYYYGIDTKVSGSSQRWYGFSLRCLAD